MLRYRSDPQINDVSFIYIRFFNASSFINHIPLFFQFEDYQQRLDYSVERITRHLKRTRTFWDNGIGIAIRGNTIQKRPNSDYDATIDKDSIESTPQNEAT